MSRQVWDAATGVTTLEGCAGFEGPLVVKRADDLSGLERFTSLRTLEIVGGEVTELGRLAGLRSLRSLKIVCVPVSDLSPLAGLTDLEDLEINFTFVEDLSSIDGLTNLGWLKLFGNPLTSKSRALVQRKRTTQVERWGRPCLVEASGDDEWKACRKLFETGAKACWGMVPRAGHTLVRPGRSLTGLIQFLQLTPEDIAEILAAPDAAKEETLVAEMWIQEGIEVGPPRFGVRWQAGRAVDATSWIRAATWLSDEEQQRHLKFVARFDDETFYREHDSLVRLSIVQNNVRFPAWLVRLRKEVLAGVRPHQHSVDVRIDRFDKRAPTRSGGSYQLGWNGYNNADLRAVLHDQLGLFPIAEIVEPSDLGHSVLAVNVRAPDDRAIYEVDPMYAAAGLLAVTPVFASFGALLDQVTAISR
jgi:hypothetical protein